MPNWNCLVQLFLSYLKNSSTSKIIWKVLSLTVDLWVEEKGGEKGVMLWLLIKGVSHELSKIYGGGLIGNDSKSISNGFISSNPWIDWPWTLEHMWEDIYVASRWPAGMVVLVLMVIVSCRVPPCRAMVSCSSSSCVSWGKLNWSHISDSEFVMLSESIVVISVSVLSIRIVSTLRMVTRSKFHAKSPNCGIAGTRSHEMCSSAQQSATPSKKITSCCLRMLSKSSPCLKSSDIVQWLFIFKMGRKELACCSNWTSAFRENSSENLCEMLLKRLNIREMKMFTSCGSWCKVVKIWYVGATGNRQGCGNAGCGSCRKESECFAT